MTDPTLTVIPPNTQRIVICVYDSSSNRVGGPMIWAMDFAKHLKALGYNIRLFILQHDITQPGKITKYCELHSIPFTILDTSKCPYIEPQVSWIIEQTILYRPDILVANLVLPAMYSAKFLRPFGINTITVIHSDPSHDNYYRDIVDRLLSSKDFYPDAVVSVAKFIDREITLKTGNTIPQRVVIPCGAPHLSLPNRPAFSKPKLIYTGRLITEQKRIRETTESLLRVCKGLNLTATICGDGPEKPWLEQRLTNQTAVKFKGLLSPNELRETMKEHHAFVLLSDYEGMSISLTEAMSLGVVPICLKKINGIDEIISHNQNGLIVKNRNSDFQRAVKKICHAGTWERLSENARRTFVERYSHDITFPQWQSLFNSLYSKSIQPTRPSKIRIPEHGQAFKDYPANRPDSSSIMNHGKKLIRKFSVLAKLRNIKTSLKKFSKPCKD